MSISSSTSRMDYTGNGSVSVYAYTFPIVLDSDLLVTVNDGASPPVETVLTLTTDYTVSGAGSSSGGNVTLVAGNLASGKHLTIRRVRPLTQLTDIRNQGEFFPEIHEDAFDNATMVAQQLQDQVAKSLRLAETDTAGIGKLPNATTRASSFLAFDSNGDPIAAAGVSSVAISSFMETVLDDTTAAAARATLEIPNSIELLSNKKLQDSTTTIVDNSDNTKAFKFQASGITAGQTRELTVPDSDLTIAGIATTQTLTNKTMSGASNTFSAIPLASQSSGASSAGQILISTGSSACSWQTPPIAIAYRSTNLSLTTSTTTDVVADTEVIDSASAYDNTTGIFTVPAGQGGLYEIGASLIFASSGAFNGSTEIFGLDLAGTQSINLLQIVPVSASINIHHCVSVIVSLSASDTAKITAIQDSGSGHNIIGNIGSRIWFRKLPG